MMTLRFKPVFVTPIQPSIEKEEFGKNTDKQEYADEENETEGVIQITDTNEKVQTNKKQLEITLRFKPVFATSIQISAEKEEIEKISDKQESTNEDIETQDVIEIVDPDEEEVPTDKDLKRCSNCGKEHHIKNFISLNNGTETKRCITCRKIGNEYNKTNLLHETYKILKQNMGPCVMCGDSDPEHLEFNHLDQSTKLGEVKRMTTPIKKIEESKKCAPFCRKCHCRHTFSNQQCGERVTTILTDKHKARNRAREFLINLKKQLGGCQNPGCCDVFDPDVLQFYEFDHIDFLKKCHQISDMVAEGRSIEAIKEELEKCILLCAYCHRIKTKEDVIRRQEYYLSLERPLVKKEKQIQPPLLDNAIIVEIRKSYNEGTISQKELATKFNIKSSTVLKILDNIRYKDANYIRTRYDKKLTLDNATQIRKMYSKGIATMSICKIYNIKARVVYKIVNNKTFFDKNYTMAKLPKEKKINMTFQDAQNIRNFFDRKEKTIDELALEYNVADTHIKTILNNSTHSDPNYTPSKISNK